MSLTAADVAEIMRLLDESAFDELSLETDGFKLHLRRGPAGVESADAPFPVPRAKSKAAAPAAPPPKRAAAAPSEPGLVEVPAPLLGVFYRAPKPGAAAFIEVGAQVEEDTVVAIIEVMKLMNSVRAGVRGEVVEVLAQNGALVEYGEALVRVRAAG